MLLRTGPTLHTSGAFSTKSNFSNYQSHPEAIDICEKN